MKSLAALKKSLIRMKETSRELRSASSQQKNQTLRFLHREIKAHKKEIFTANQKDLNALGDQSAPAFRDRLLLDEKRLGEILESIEQVIALPDPVGEVVETRTLPNRLQTRRVRAPLGAIFMIFESRPNVAIEAFTLGFKAGNSMILRGGKESRHTVSVFYQLIERSIQRAKLPSACFVGITHADRKWVDFVLQQNALVDVVVPRGGAGLIAHVMKNTTIPVIKNDRGLCHIYVHQDADLKMAQEIIINAKTQRPGVCNSAETLLVHHKRAHELLPALNQRLRSLRVEVFADPRARNILGAAKNVKPAIKTSWDTEYLDLKLNVRVVDSLESAIAHIETHGSKHSEAIVTKSKSAAQKFQTQIDAAALYWNASTRFTDGFQLGLGGELGISTQKLHVRGPVGLKELTSVRWIMVGNGQTRQ